MTEQKNSSKLRRLFKGLVWTAAALVALLSLLVYIPDWWWGLELLAHLRFQYGLALSLALVVLVFMDGRRAAWLLLPLAWNLLPLLPLYLAASPPPAAAADITITHYNLDRTASDHRAALAYLQEHPSDLLSLQEVTPELERDIAAAFPDYSIVYSHPRKSTHGSMLLLAPNSRLTVVKARIIHLPEGNARRLIQADFLLDGQPISFLSLHVIRPQDSWTTGYQQVELSAVAAWSRQQQATGQQVIIMGDFNSTPWSYLFQELLAEGNLTNSLSGFGWQPTWPALLPFPARIPIDHALASDGLVFSQRTVGAPLGGDHLPLRVGVRLGGNE